MATSSKITYHTRSISLPTRSSALTLAVEEQLCRLRSLELATSSSRSISQSLTGLKDLYESVEDFLHLQPIQQENCLDSALDGFLLLLDACGSTRDVLSQMKQCVQDLLSSIRRKRYGKLGLTVELKEYMSSRKKVTKMIRKCLEGLKKMQYENSDKVAIVNMLRQVEVTTISVFESVVSFLSGSKAQKQSSWSLICKLVLNTQGACEENENETNDFVEVEMALNTFINNRQHKAIVNAKSIQKPLETLEMSIQNFEEVLEGVFRGLIKIRVSLLNILN
ncbi:hypothetical protein MKW94_009413 [Papaver nudicaule]|uniref:DUF241 domain protein n=1 Tax=Papaver nudicaule TaxID=74823 RepID=A0AA41W0E2_PAPNU|nr:hypothetical protein [Papaver nudicaule]